LPRVLTYSAESNGTLAGLTNGLTPAGIRHCVQITLEDGRTLELTGDHRVLTSEGWIPAEELVLNQSRLVCSVDFPLSDLEVSNWRLQLGEFTFTMDSAHAISRSLALARVLGYMLADGSCSFPYRASCSLDHSLDVESFSQDLHLIFNLAPAAVYLPNEHRNTYEVLFPKPMVDLFNQLDTFGSNRTGEHISFPAFIMDPNLPLSFLREFLGGLFGGDGRAPVPSCSRLHDGFDSVYLCCSRTKQQLGSLNTYLNNLHSLLQRINIVVASIDQPVEHSGSYSDKTAGIDLEANEKKYQQRIIIGRAELVKFNDSIGFRHCVHKQQRLAVATTWYRYRESITKQRTWVVDRVKELTAFDHAEKVVGQRSIPGFTGRNTKMSIPAALSQATRELKEREAVIEQDYSIPNYDSIKAILNRGSDIGASRYKRAKSVWDWLKHIEAEELFSEVKVKLHERRNSNCSTYYTSTEEVVEEVRQVEDKTEGKEDVEEKEQSKLRYGVGRDRDSRPVFYLRAIDRRNTGPKQTFDIGVPKTQSFVANGIVIHNCLKPHLGEMLRYGCTRLEIGVQSVYEDVARDTNRGHTVRSVTECFHLAKDAGFKVVSHLMPDLPNVGYERDMNGFKRFFEDPKFRADGLKIYPTLVIRGTGLYELWKGGKYKNYHPDELVDLLAKLLALVPPWTRIYRIQRDIPMPLVTSGVEYGNLRELCLKRMHDLGYKCRDVRTREVGIKDIHHKVKPDQVELIRRDYNANGGWETFLSYEDPKQDILIGLLRLRRCSAATFRPELTAPFTLNSNNTSTTGGEEHEDDEDDDPHGTLTAATELAPHLDDDDGPRVSIVRELHVYGTAVPLHSRDPKLFQHQGYGTLLMEEAERIAREEHGSFKLAVIAGVGTRHYYRKLGYELDGPYMSKLLY